MSEQKNKVTRLPDAAFSPENRASIFEPGPDDRLYRLKQGLVRLYASHDDGHTVTLRYVKPGQYFGLEVLSGQPRVVGAETLVPSEFDTYRVEDLTSEEHMRVLEQSAEELAAQLRNSRRFATLTLREAVAAELTELLDTPLAGLDRGKPAIWLKHDELAALVGSVRETVTKLIGELIEEDLLESRYKRLRVLDAEGLAKVADGGYTFESAA